MSTVNFTIPLGSVDTDKLETDDDFRREAERLLPDALTGIGERMAELAWDELQKSFRGIPGFKVNSSPGERSKFIREGGQKYRREISPGDRQGVVDHLIHQLREIKAKAGQSG